MNVIIVYYYLIMPSFNRYLIFCVVLMCKLDLGLVLCKSLLFKPDFDLALVLCIIIVQTSDLDLAL